jgi:hypothetical protein
VGGVKAVLCFAYNNQKLNFTCEYPKLQQTPGTVFKNGINQSCLNYVHKYVPIKKERFRIEQKIIS